MHGESVRQSKGSCSRTYHMLVTVLILLAGMGLLGVGIWRRVNRDEAPFNLSEDFIDETDELWSLVLRFDLAAIVVGIFLIISGIIGLIGVAKNCLGGVARVLYLILAVVILLGCGGIAGVSFYLLARGTGQDSRLESYSLTAWESGVSADPDAICVFENDFKCRGFEDGDCAACPTGEDATCTEQDRMRCAPCSGATSSQGTGCFEKLTGSLRTYYIIAGAVFSAITLIVLTDIFTLCTL